MIDNGVFLGPKLTEKALRHQTGSASAITGLTKARLIVEGVGGSTMALYGGTKLFEGIFLANREKRGRW